MGEIVFRILYAITEPFWWFVKDTRYGGSVVAVIVVAGCAMWVHNIFSDIFRRK